MRVEEDKHEHGWATLAASRGGSGRLRASHEGKCTASLVSLARVSRGLVEVEVEGALDPDEHRDCRSRNSSQSLVNRRKKPLEEPVEVVGSTEE